MLISTLVRKEKVIKVKLPTDSMIETRTPLRVKLPNVAYLPPLEHGSYQNTVPIRNYKKYETGQEFKATLSCYLSKHPHLQFETFHRYDNNPPQIIFLNTTNNRKVSILVSEFREYNPLLCGGYKSIARSLDDVLEKR
jgi:hypothetical protein